MNDIMLTTLLVISLVVNGSSFFRFNRPELAKLRLAAVVGSGFAMLIFVLPERYLLLRLAIAAALCVNCIVLQLKRGKHTPLRETVWPEVLLLVTAIGYGVSLVSWK